MNQLEHRQEFEDVLEHYKLSPSAAKLLANMQLVILSGPSGAGRNTIIDQLLKVGGYGYIVSDTTRQPRTNNGIMEVNGVNYWFRQEADFLRDLRAGNFLEAEIIHNQQVSGISIRELEKVYAAGLTAITEVEIGGFKNILTLKPDAIGIFVLPPDFDVWLERLKKRGELPQAELVRRLNTGIRIFKAALTNKSASIVINDRLSEAVKVVDSIVSGVDPSDQDSALDIATNLLNRTREYLSQLPANS